MIGQIIHLLTFMRCRPLILMVRRGAEFITNLRVQWIVRRNAQRESGVDGPMTVQLLGSRDDMVALDDNIDLVSGSNFIYLDVPQTRKERWATETSSCGYFPMAPFLSPFGRRAKVEWMMDQYAEALAKYPRADFYYVGHSNGTYLLAKALQLYRACRFERVVFAGSVVRRKYDWSTPLARQQVKSVLNFVATADWVVAFFPRLFEYIRIQDLGGAGHLGFRFVAPDRRLQNRLVQGPHDAGIREHLWDDIAAYLLDEVLPPDTRQPRSLLVALLGGFPPIVWIGILAALYGIWSLISRVTPDGFATGFIFAVYLTVIVLFLRRV